MLQKELKSDEYFMQEALIEAKKALGRGDVPVGCVIVKDGKIISRAYNKKENKQNAINHAEILAISKACKKLKSFRLDDCELFVTLEPCPMCCGAILSARVKRVCFGAYDKNYGCVGSKYNFLEDSDFEHLIENKGGILQKECENIIKEFFKSVRENKRESGKNKFLGQVVSVKVDRPIGSLHPKYKDLKYEVNYGFIPNTKAKDGEEIDVYILRENKPLKNIKGKVVGIIKRIDDIEDKLVVMPLTNCENVTKKEIKKATQFQEKYFKSKIILK